MHCPRNIYWSCLSKVCFYFRKNLLFQDELTPSLSRSFISIKILTKVTIWEIMPRIFMNILCSFQIVFL